MKIKIKRIPSRKQPPMCNQSGTLHIDNQYVCDTEENILTALPAGNYRICRHHCKQYGRHMPIILPASPTAGHTPDCSQCRQLEYVSLNTHMPCQCPMLRGGNGVHHLTDGSIILGTRSKAGGCLIHPLKAFNPLAERIRKALKRGTAITLAIQ